MKWGSSAPPPTTTSLSTTSSSGTSSATPIAGMGGWDWGSYSSPPRPSRRGRPRPHVRSLHLVTALALTAGGLVHSIGTLSLHEVRERDPPLLPPMTTALDMLYRHALSRGDQRKQTGLCLSAIFQLIFGTLYLFIGCLQPHSCYPNGIFGLLYQCHNATGEMALTCPLR